MLEISAYIKHFFMAWILPALISAAFSLVIYLCCGKKTVCITSPQAALSNISSFISMILGFIFTFASIILGLSGTSQIKTIFSNRAPRFQFWCTLLAPMLTGLIAWCFTTFLSATLADSSINYVVAKLIPYGATLLLFIFSFVISSILFIKVINITARQ